MDHSKKKQGFIHYSQSPEIKGIHYLDPIIRAIEQEEVLRLYYLPFYEDKPYFNEVHPYLLKEHESRWYLIGLNDFKGKMRTYALDRIRDLQVVKGTAYKAPHFKVEDYFKYAIGIMAPEGTPPLIKLAVQLTQAQYLITRPWHDSQNIEEENEERVVFSFRVFPTYEFRSLVLGLGKDAAVLEPRSLREEIKQELESMLKHYQRL
ncbi:MAG: WYL domain-containing protein [Bacteroidales bacterium]|nr:WYL domain-containing protein [Bacteroidales bacterium]